MIGDNLGEGGIKLGQILKTACGAGRSARADEPRAEPGTADLVKRMLKSAGRRIDLSTPLVDDHYLTPLALGRLAIRASRVRIRVRASNR